MRCSRIERVEIKDFGTDISLDKDFEELEQALRDTIINELAFIGKLEIKSRESQLVFSALFSCSSQLIYLKYFQSNCIRSYSVSFT